MSEGATPPPEVPTIVGRWVRLRPIQQSDYNLLYSAEQDPSVSVFFRHRGASVSPEEYPRTLWAGVFCQFAVVTRDDTSLVGLATAYNPDLRNGHCRIAAFTLPAARRLGWSLEGIDLFISYLLRVFPFRKLYLDVLEFNMKQFGSIVGHGAAVEATLTEHEFHDGRYWSLFTLAIARESWLSARSARTGTLASYVSGGSVL